LACLFIRDISNNNIWKQNSRVYSILEVRYLKTTQSSELLIRSSLVKLIVKTKKRINERVKFSLIADRILNFKSFYYDEI